MTYLIGIDPGFTGSMAITNKGKLVEIISCPLLEIKTGKTKVANMKRVPETKTRVDPRGIYLALEKYRGKAKCVIEHSQAMPKQGVSSVFVYAEGYGAYLGVLSSLNIEYHEVRSSVWKAKMVLDHDKYKSIDTVLKLYPESSKYIKLRKDDGKAEALLLAHYGEQYVWKKN